MSASGAAAQLREEFPHFCGGSVGEQVLLKTPPVAKEKIRGSLVNDVSREQVERRVDVAKAFGVHQAVLALGAGAFGLVEKPAEVLACCLSISRLVGAADHNVQAGPTRLAKVVTPSSEQRVQLIELHAHSQLRSFDGVRSQRADVFLESLEVHGAFRENPVDERARAGQQLRGCVRCGGCR